MTSSLRPPAVLLLALLLHLDAALLAVRDGRVEQVTGVAEEVVAVAALSVVVTADLSEVHVADLVLMRISQAAPVANT